MEKVADDACRAGASRRQWRVSMAARRVNLSGPQAARFAQT